MLTKTPSFNDGLVKIYSVTNSAADGDMPAETLALKDTLRYEERVVGLQRYYTGRQNAVDIKYVLRCPLVRSVSAQDIAIPNDGRQYRIDFVQYPPDAEPPVMDLTLVDIAAEYDIGGAGDES